MAPSSKGNNKKTNLKKDIKNSLELSFETSGEHPSETPMNNLVNEPSLQLSSKKERKNLSSTKKDKPVVDSLTNKTETISFAPDKPIYLQIHTANVYSIFGAGIIASNNKPFTDIQTLIPNGFVLSNGYINSLDESTLLLELNFTKAESISILIQEGNGFYFKPIPISRIKRIHVMNGTVKKDIITTALSNDGGIIPDSLVIPSFPNNPIKSSFEEFTLKPIDSDFTTQLMKFDKILGCFAFLKNYSYLLSNRTQSLSPLPDHYLYAAQALNSSSSLQLRKPEKSQPFYQQLFQIKNGIESPLLQWLFERVNIAKNFTDDDTKEFGNLLFSNSKNKEFSDDSKEILESLSKSLNRKNTILKIPTLNDVDKFYLYLFALLRSYGNINSENKTISRADLPEFIFLAYGEFGFALLGYFFGYKILRNFDDKLQIKDATIAQYANVSKRIPIKFELTTLLDYVIIESVYHNVFNTPNALVDTTFLEADSIKSDRLISSASLPSDYLYSVEEVFGKQIFYLKKKSLVEDLTMGKNMIPKEIPAISDLGVFCFRKGIPWHFSNLGELLANPKRISYLIFFRRDDIMDAVKNNKINAQELLQRVELSKQYKDFE